MTTVRVRRARPETLEEHKIDKGARELVEVTAHGQVVAVVDVEQAGYSPRTRESKVIVWNHDAFDDSVGKAIVELVQAAVPVMAQARYVFTS